MGKTLEHVTAQAELRGPQNLLTNQEQKRHQKVVDIETVCYHVSLKIITQRGSDASFSLVSHSAGSVSLYLILYTGSTRWVL